MTLTGLAIKAKDNPETLERLCYTLFDKPAITWLEVECIMQDVGWEYSNDIYRHYEKWQHEDEANPTVKRFRKRKATN